jgi:hypothetical protein
VHWRASARSATNAEFTHSKLIYQFATLQLLQLHRRATAGVEPRNVLAGALCSIELVLRVEALATLAQTLERSGSFQLQMSTSELGFTALPGMEATPDLPGNFATVVVELCLNLGNKGLRHPVVSEETLAIALGVKYWPFRSESNIVWRNDFPRA